MTTSRHVILNHVDSPLKILFWTKGEILMFFLPFVGGIFLNHTGMGSLLAILNLWGMARFKKRFGKGTLQAVMYWYLPPSRKLKAFPPSYIREYLG